VGGRGVFGGYLPALPENAGKGGDATDIPRLHPEDPVGKALETLLTSEVRHLPVVDQGNRVVGILTRSDFLKLILGRR